MPKRDTVTPALLRPVRAVKQWVERASAEISAALSPPPVRSAAHVPVPVVQRPRRRR